MPTCLRCSARSLWVNPHRAKSRRPAESTESGGRPAGWELPPKLASTTADHDGGRGNSRSSSGRTRRIALPDSAGRWSDGPEAGARGEARHATVQPGPPQQRPPQIVAGPAPECRFPGLGGPVRCDRRRLRVLSCHREGPKPGPPRAAHALQPHRGCKPHRDSVAPSIGSAAADPLPLRNGLASATSWRRASSTPAERMAVDRRRAVLGGPRRRTAAQPAP